MEKSAGILLPLFAVPGNQGIGDLGQKTLMMIDEISKAGYTVWSMLPLHCMASDASPFDAVSAYAGDPIYINIDRLAEMGLLTQSSIINHNKFKNYVDYKGVRDFKEFYFQRAYKAFRKHYADYKAEFEQFKREAFWLNDWTVYAVFRKANDMKGWLEWPAEFQNWPEKQEVALKNYVDDILYIQFLQFIFYKQLDEVTQYARSRNLKLMQDVPFFVNLDSTEVWRNKKEYMIRPNGEMLERAGTPPDSIYTEGQAWEQPMYNFEQMRENQYQSFRSRVSWTARNFDMIRFVHFKGMDALWKIPGDAPASHGRWAAGPGRELMNLIRQDNPDTQFTAEDQGALKASLRELEREFGILSMDVLQHRLETKMLKRPVFEQSVVYTSCYDTPTLEEDYNEFSNNKKIALRRFFKKRGYDHRPFHDLVTHFALDTEASLVLLFLPDIMGLKESGKATVWEEGKPNLWNWKLKDLKTLPEHLEKTTEWLKSSGRLVMDAEAE